MRFGITILIVAFLAGCSTEHSPFVQPTAPAPNVPPGTPPAPPASSNGGAALLWVMVIGESGGCLDGGTIQVVSADGAGQAIPQETPCGVWDYGGGVVLHELTPGVEIRLRGAARGYTSREAAFLPFRVPGPYRAVFIELSKTQ